MSIFSSKTEEEISLNDFFGIRGQPKQKTNEQIKLKTKFKNCPAPEADRRTKINYNSPQWGYEIPLHIIKKYNKTARIERAMKKRTKKVLGIILGD